VRGGRGRGRGRGGLKMRGKIIIERDNGRENISSVGSGRYNPPRIGLDAIEISRLTLDFSFLSSLPCIVV